MSVGISMKELLLREDANNPNVPSCYSKELMMYIRCAHCLCPTIVTYNAGMCEDCRPEFIGGALAGMHDSVNGTARIEKRRDAHLHTWRALVALAHPCPQTPTQLGS